MALPNSEKITSQIAMLPDAALKQMAMMHKSDPYVLPLIISEDGRRKQMRQAAQAQMAAMPQPKVADAAVAQMGSLPEEQGIGALPAPNMQHMADGGIAGFDESTNAPITRENLNAMGRSDGMFNYAHDGGGVMRMAAGGMPGYKKGGLTPELEKYIDEQAQLNGVPASTLRAVIQAESEGKVDAQSKTSTAQGLMQLINRTFTKGGGDPEKRTDPFENIRVGAKVLGQDAAALRGQLKRDVSPEELYATHVLGRGTGSRLLQADPNMTMAEVLKSADPANADKIIKSNSKLFGNGKKTAGEVMQAFSNKMAPVLTAAVPASSAQAANLPAPASSAPPSTEKERYLTGNQGVIGAGETALQYLTGALAIPTAGGAAVLEQLPNVLSGKGADRAEMEKSFREKAGQVTYEPRTVGGKTVSEGFGQTLEDLKIPPYIARIGAGTPKGPAARPSAEGIAGIAEQMKQAAAEQKAKVSNLRLENKPSGEKQTLISNVEGTDVMPEKTRASVGAAFEDLNAAEKAARDAAAWEKAAQEAKNAPDYSKYAGAMDEAQLEAARARGISALAGVTPSSIEAQKRGTSEGATYDPNKMVAVSPDEFGGGEATPRPSDIIAAAKDVTPEKKKGGLEDEDYLMMGLNLLANKDPNFFNAVGESGLKTVAAKKEREKRETDLEYKDIMKKYYGALGTKAETEAKQLEAGTKYNAVARQHAMDNISREMQKWEQSLGGVTATPQQIEAKRLELAKFYFPLAGVELPSTMTATAGVAIPQGVKVTRG